MRKTRAALLAFRRRAMETHAHLQAERTMPHITTPDGTKLYYEEAGGGTPVVFVHEYAGDFGTWEPQMRYFSRGHRCVTYSQRGYPPSDVPTDPNATARIWRVTT
jgi:pimeloyl-ACP methyl ester carboxylesterase